MKMDMFFIRSINVSSTVLKIHNISYREITNSSWKDVKLNTVKRTLMNKESIEKKYLR